MYVLFMAVVCQSVFLYVCVLVNVSMTERMLWCFKCKNICRCFRWEPQLYVNPPPNGTLMMSMRHNNDGRMII